MAKTMKKSDDTAKPALESTAEPHDDLGGAGGDAPDAEASVVRRRFKEVWLVEDRKNHRSVWTRVGTAFENADGSWNIRLSALPVGAGRLNMRDPLPREQVSA